MIQHEYSFLTLKSIVHVPYEFHNGLYSQAAVPHELRDDALDMERYRLGTTSRAHAQRTRSC
jgi:hypothetical protein